MTKNSLQPACSSCFFEYNRKACAQASKLLLYQIISHLYHCQQSTLKLSSQYHWLGHDHKNIKAGFCGTHLAFELITLPVGGARDFLVGSFRAHSFDCRRFIALKCMNTFVLLISEKTSVSSIRTVDCNPLGPKSDQNQFSSNNIHT